METTIKIKKGVHGITAEYPSQIIPRIGESVLYSGENGLFINGVVEDVIHINDLFGNSVLIYVIDK
jgi:hypothetical protein